MATLETTGKKTLQIMMVDCCTFSVFFLYNIYFILLRANYMCYYYMLLSQGELPSFLPLPFQLCLTGCIF